ncbi:MAG: ABC transporter permease [Nitrospirota bacterium]|nr:ABC transporter permease [Nitrospirota bacterium]
MKRRLVLFSAQVYVLLKKEMLQFLRDKVLLFIVLFTFTANIVILGKAFTLEVKNVPTALYDMSKSYESRLLIEGFRASGRFRFVKEIDSLQEGDRLLSKGDISLIIAIPADFARNLRKGASAKVLLSTDGTDSNQALIALSYAANITGTFFTETLEERLSLLVPAMARGLVPQIEEKIRVRYNANRIDERYLSLMEMCRSAFAICVILTAASIVREKEVGTAAQLYVTPISKTTLLIGKIVPVIIIVMVALLIGTLFNIVFLDTPLRGSYMVFWVLSIPFLLFSVAIGLLLADFSRTFQQVLLGAFLLLMPIMFISGSLVPIETMPKALQQLTYFFPLRYYLNITTGVFFRGVGIGSFWADALIMTGLGLLAFSVSVWFFRKSLD